MIFWLLLIFLFCKIEEVLQDGRENELGQKINNCECVWRVTGTATALQEKWADLVNFLLVTNSLMTSMTRKWRLIRPPWSLRGGPWISLGPHLLSFCSLISALPNHLSNISLTHLPRTVRICILYPVDRKSPEGRIWFVFYITPPPAPDSGKKDMLNK